MEYKLIIYLLKLNFNKLSSIINLNFIYKILIIRF